MSYSVYADHDTYLAGAWSITPGDLPKVFLGMTAGTFILTGLEHSFEPLATGLGIITVVAWYKNNL